MIDVFIKRGNLNTDMHTGKMPCEDEGSDLDWGNASLSQGIPKIASKPPEFRQEAWNRVFLSALRRNQPCQHLDIGLPASRSVRQ